MKKVLLLAVSMTICLVGSLNAEQNIENIFEAKYQAWKEFCSRSRVKWLSHAGPTFTCNEFKEIVNLGLPALPYIAKKLEQDQRLWKAIEVIAKVKIRGEYDSNTNKVVFPDFPEVKPGEDHYLYWWREGHKLTKNKFDELYSKWKQVKEKNDVDSEKYYQSMINLGLPVIPFMISEIEDGDSDLVAAISHLTDGEIKNDASPKECSNWWNNSKERWTIKFDDSEPIDDKK